MKVVVCASINDLISKVVADAARKQRKGFAALKRAQRAAVEAAKEACPVDTGELKSSIREEGMNVIADAEHAVFVHNGTSKSPPRPFMLAGRKAAKESLKKDLDK